MSRTLISPQKGDTTLPVLYHYSTLVRKFPRNTPTCLALKLWIVCIHFELQSIFKVQFILYWKLERRVYPGCTIFCVEPMCCAAEPCCMSSVKTGFGFCCFWKQGEFNKHKWNSHCWAIRKLSLCVFCVLKVKNIQHKRVRLKRHVLGARCNRICSRDIAPGRVFTDIYFSYSYRFASKS